MATGTTGNMFFSNMRLINSGTLSGSYIGVFNSLKDNSIEFFYNSNNPSDAPTDNKWGGAIVCRQDFEYGFAFSFSASKVYFAKIEKQNNVIVLKPWLLLSNV